MAHRSYSSIQDLMVQPNHERNKGGGIPHDTCPNVPPQGMEGAKHGFIDLYHTQIKSDPVPLINLRRPIVPPIFFSTTN